MTERDTVRRAYDELAESYAAERSSDAAAAARLDSLVGRLPETPRVLDAGCGGGDPVLAALDDEKARAVGLDFSGEQLRLARETVPGAALVRGDMIALPFREGSFDAATALHSLIHVPLADHRTVLEEFARVLRPRGSLLLTEGHEEWVGENPDWLGTGTGMRWEIAGREETREGLEATGFEVLEEWDRRDELAEDGSSKPSFLVRLSR
ncbi:MAG: class I SAM-dependent methyltransferase [Haloarculaceae archaeon]